MIKNFALCTLLFFGLSAVSLAHTRLAYPSPRNSNAGLKTGPCGGLPRTGNPTVIPGGQNLTISWEETINHPGKFLFALSMANDADFQANPLGTVIDTQNDGQTPHTYTTSVAIPNINCDTCTIQLIQSMEENPNAPTYYYSCADVKIVANGSSTGALPVQGQGVSTSKAAPSMAGCGLVKVDGNAPPPSLKFAAVIALLLLTPFGLALGLRRQRVPVTIQTRQRLRRY